VVKGVRLELNLAQIKPKNVLTCPCSRRKKPRGRRGVLVDYQIKREKCMMIKQMVKVTFLVTIFMVLFHGIILAGPIKYTVGGHVAALTEELLDKTISLSVAKDYQALQELLDSKMVIVLKKGLKVEVVDTKLFSGQVKIRSFGTNIELWTVIEALTDTKVKDTENTTEKEAKESDGLYSLNINATPSDSIIKIMNITPKYEPGIKLKTGKYDVLVAKNGYKEWREWVEIVNSNLSIDVSLESKSSNSSIDETGKTKQKWYEGGTLHQKSALIWQTASQKNKLATCADLVAVMLKQKMLKESIQEKINSVDDIKFLATELVVGLDAAFKKSHNEAENKKLYTNQKVNETAAMLVMMMGWLK